MASPMKLTDPVKVREIVENYFTERENAKEVLSLKNGDKRVYKTPPSVLGLCLKLGISREGFYRYIDRESESYNKEICDTLTHAKDRIAQELLEGVLQGYWNEKVAMAQLAKYGELGDSDSEKTVKIIMQGSSDWSR